MHATQQSRGKSTLAQRVLFRGNITDERAWFGEYAPTKWVSETGALSLRSALLRFARLVWSARPRPLHIPSRAPAIRVRTRVCDFLPVPSVRVTPAVCVRFVSGLPGFARLVV